MKNRTFFPVISIFILALSYTDIRAQDYVVTIKFDTIHGKAKPLFAGHNAKVQITTIDKAKTSYTLFEVKAFTYKSETYHPLKGPNGYTFMKLIKSGYLSYYAFQQENQVTFDGFYLTKMDGSGIEVPNLGFKKTMTNFLIDCDSVVSRIDKGKLGKRDIHKIVDEYNAYIASKTLDHSKLISLQKDQNKKISGWDTLEEKLRSHPDFEGKANALEMITDIKGKISRGDKVPNFLTEGLRSIINPTEFKSELENAMKELN